MQKRDFKIIFLTIFLALFLNLFFGRWIAAKISTLPLLNKWKIISPESSIVIVQKQEVAAGDSKEVVQATEKAKTKVSEVLKAEKGGFVPVGEAANLTSDGLFLSANEAVKDQTAAYYVFTLDGRFSLLAIKAADAASGLVFLKADLNNLSASPFGDSENLRPGEKVLLLHPEEGSGGLVLRTSLISSKQKYPPFAELSADALSRGFVIESLPQILPGQPIFNLNAELVGMQVNGRVLAADVLKNATNLFFENSDKIQRPSFGFIYQNITLAESQIQKLPMGARVLEVVSGKSKLPAAQAGMKNGDIIFQVDDQKLSKDLSLEEVLQKYKPQDQVKFFVLRGKDTVQLTLNAGELK